MTAPDEPAAGSRTLADILREAGIEPGGRGGRRRAEPAAESGSEPGTDGAEQVSRPPRHAGPQAQPAQESEPRPNRVLASAPEPVRVPEPPSGSPPVAVGTEGSGREAVEVGNARPASRRAGALGWVVFAVELVAAAVLGVLIWYAFGLLWELYPYAAAVVTPFVLAGVVTGAQVLRRWRSREPLGSLAVTALLVVAAFLVVFPAATVLAQS